MQEEDKEEMKEILEMKRVHEKLVKRRRDKILKEQAEAERLKQQQAEKEQKDEIIQF